jgi:hypothetical protein
MIFPRQKILVISDNSHASLTGCLALMFHRHKFL